MTVAESMALPQITHRGTMAEVKDGWGRYKAPNSPFKFTNAYVQAQLWIPEQGQHNNEILVETGQQLETGAAKG